MTTCTNAVFVEYRSPDTEVTFYAKANDNVLPAEKLLRIFENFNKDEMDRMLSPNIRIEEADPVKKTEAREQSTTSSVRVSFKLSMPYMMPQNSNPRERPNAQ